jgi:DUF4097 and DUF4098 domain-containing protein YvlB
MRVGLILLSCFLSSALLSQETQIVPEKDPRATYREREEKEFRFYPGGRMTIASKVPGEVRILGWDKGTVRVEAEKVYTGSSSESAKPVFEKHPLRVRYNQTSAKIDVDGHPDDDQTIACNLTIYVPGYKTDLQATLDRGDISVKGVNGWIEASTNEGRLEAVSLAGYFSGRTQKGDIRVEMSGRRWNGLELGAVTRLGAIDLVLPEDYSASLQIETLDGNVLVDYPPQMVDGEPVDLNVGIRKKAQAIDASIGSGGAPIKLISQAGDVRLSAKR